MNKTTRLKRPQVPKPEEMFPFDNLTDRPKYGGVEMTHETDIPHADTLRQEAAALVIAEANARDDADDALQDQIDGLSGDLGDEVTNRQDADLVLQGEIDTLVASSDVKDIVGTKAELDNYDTSTLGDNDIIKVLSDETQSGATTYYRWVANTSSFSLIGSEGPYYTKGEADALLADKANTSDVYTKSEIDVSLGALTTKDVQASTDTDLITNTEPLLTRQGMMRQWVDITQTGLPANVDLNTFYYTVEEP